MTYHLDVAMNYFQAVHMFQRMRDLGELEKRPINRESIANIAETVLTSFSLLTFGCCVRW